MKHPNTEWLLVVHENGPDAPDKPFRNHYGVRVTNNEEVDRAYQYLMARKSRTRLEESRHAQRALRLLFGLLRRARRQLLGDRVLSAPPRSGLAVRCFVSLDQSDHRKSIPRQRLYSRRLSPTGPSNATTGNLPSNFTPSALGMEMITHVTTPKPHNIKHPSNPWYVVSLEVPERSRKVSRPAAALHHRGRNTGASSAKLAPHWKHGVQNSTSTKSVASNRAKPANRSCFAISIATGGRSSALMTN